ncbi:Translation initiation factor IF-2 [Frankliniella fusca]|uniref:Translation initiation factor IF-2 n=1 Tax=Frankliniella fusca TaxID=407009 RepID=A0AAE1LCS7_9NEOP|nr:Translation initiation factor IF-2 [Frankliniella fusca]
MTTMVVCFGGGGGWRSSLRGPERGRSFAGGPADGGAAPTKGEREGDDGLSCVVPTNSEARAVQGDGRGRGHTCPDRPHHRCRPASTRSLPPESRGRKHEEGGGWRRRWG